MSVKKIPIADLRVGMFLVGVDVSWMDTPFLKNNFVIKSEKQIADLKQCGVKLVSIDTGKGVVPEEKPRAVPESQPPTQETRPKPVSLAKEMEQAKEVRTEVKKAAQAICDSVREGGTIKSAQLSPVVDKTVGSLFRNSQALLTLFHQKVSGLPLSDHLFSVMALALSLGQKLELSDAELEHMGMAALLMDIGWLKLPEKYFAQQYAYTDQEYEAIRKHVDYSVGIVEKGNFPREVVELVAHHHERYDGSGYPYGLAGEEIPLMSRILSVADHFTSTLKGHYDSAPVIPAAALRAVYLSAQKGGHDARLCELLVQHVGIFPMSSAVLLNTGERGVVTRLNWKTPLLPWVKIYYNKSLMPLTRPYELNLATQPDDDGKKSILKTIDPSEKKEDPAGILCFEDD